MEYRTCSTCGTILPATTVFFTYRKRLISHNNPKGLEKQCKFCVNDVRRARNGLPPKPRTLSIDQQVEYWRYSTEKKYNGLRANYWHYEED